MSRGPVLHGIGLGSHMCPDCVSYYESTDSDSVSSCLWGCVTQQPQIYCFPSDHLSYVYPQILSVLPDRGP